MRDRGAEPRTASFDVLRAVAALVVLVHHVAPAAAGVALLPRGYLAVDLFFMLSGFVMTCAYEPRFRDGLTTPAFMMRRVRQLYPTIALGIALAALAMLLRGASSAVILAVFVAELMFIPRLGGGEGGIYRLDGVQWSLALELLVNALHASLLRRMSDVALLMLAACALIALTLCTWHFGKVAMGDRGASIGAGLPRVLFPYLIGVLLARRHRHGPMPSARSRLALTTASGAMLPLLIATVVFARWGGWAMEVATVALIFPVLILWSATVDFPRRWHSAATRAGALSYPLYAVHFPVMMLILPLADRRIGTGAVLFGITALAAVVCAGLARRLLDCRIVSGWHGRRSIANVSASPLC